MFLSGRAPMLATVLATKLDGKEMCIGLLTSLHVSQLFTLQNMLGRSNLDSTPNSHSHPCLSAVQSCWAPLCCLRGLTNGVVALGSLVKVSSQTLALHKLGLFLLWDTHLGRTLHSLHLSRQLLAMEQFQLTQNVLPHFQHDLGCHEHTSSGFRGYIGSYLAADASEQDLFLTFTVINRSNPRYTKCWIETYKSQRGFCFSRTVQITKFNVLFGTGEKI